MHKTMNYLPLGILTGLTLMSGAVPASAGVSAETTSHCETDPDTGVIRCTAAGETSPIETGASVNAKVTVTAACSLSGDSTSSPHTTSISNGQAKQNIGTTTFSAVCNDTGGFAVYAVGFTDDTLGKNTMTSTGGGAPIPSGTTLDGSVSNWAMKLAAVTGSVDSPAIVSPYGSDSYAVVPTTYQRVVTLNKATTTSNGAQFTSTYAVGIGGAQAAGTYTGQVKYTLVHPTGAAAPLE